MYVKQGALKLSSRPRDEDRKSCVQATAPVFGQGVSTKIQYNSVVIGRLQTAPKSVVSSPHFRKGLNLRAPCFRLFLMAESDLDLLNYV